MTYISRGRDIVRGWALIARGSDDTEAFRASSVLNNGNAAKLTQQGALVHVHYSETCVEIIRMATHNDASWLVDEYDVSSKR